MILKDKKSIIKILIELWKRVFEELERLNYEVKRLNFMVENYWENGRVI